MSIRESGKVVADVKFLLDKRSSSALVRYLRHVVAPLTDDEIKRWTTAQVADKIPDYDIAGPKEKARAAVVLEWMDDHDGAVARLDSLLEMGERKAVLEALLELVSCGLESKFLANGDAVRLLDKNGLIEFSFRVFERFFQSHSRSEDNISSMRGFQKDLVEYYESTGKPENLRVFILEGYCLLGEYDKALEILGTELPIFESELLVKSNVVANHHLVEDRLSSNAIRFDTHQERLALLLYAFRNFFTGKSNGILDAIIHVADWHHHPETVMQFCVTQARLNQDYPFGNPKTETEIPDREAHMLSARLAMVECALKNGYKAFAFHVLDAMQEGRDLFMFVRHTPLQGELVELVSADTAVLLAKKPGESGGFFI